MSGSWGGNDDAVTHIGPQPPKRPYYSFTSGTIVLDRWFCRAMNGGNPKPKDKQTRGETEDSERPEREREREERERRERRRPTR